MCIVNSLGISSSVYHFFGEKLIRRYEFFACGTASCEDEEEYQKWLDLFGNSRKTIYFTEKNNIINTTKLANMKKGL